jgi:hypothetical protein
LEIKRLKGKNNGEKGMLEKRTKGWIKKETSEAMKGLFWIIENSIV